MLGEGFLGETFEGAAIVQPLAKNRSWSRNMWDTSFLFLLFHFCLFLAFSLLAFSLVLLCATRKREKGSGEKKERRREKRKGGKRYQRRERKEEKKHTWRAERAPALRGGNCLAIRAGVFFLFHKISLALFFCSRQQATRQQVRSYLGLVYYLLSSCLLRTKKQSKIK